MTDFLAIIKQCNLHSMISAKVIDNFLMYYAVEKEEIEPRMISDFGKFKHLDFGVEQIKFLNMFKAEYVVSKIFLKNGFIKKFLNHSAVKKLPEDEYRFLKQQAEHPWKFSFAEIVNNPADGFYEMEDVFSHDTYLLYSPSIKLTLEETTPNLWFNLIGYNGQCWQTFGVVAHFRAFDADDIFFFATEVNSSIEDDEELINEIEINPVPFFMLMSASENPMISNNGNLIIHNTSVAPIQSFSLDTFNKKFTSAWNDDVFQLKLNNWSEFPHYAIAYIDEKKNTISRTALTDLGFDKLTKALNQNGLNLTADSDIRVSLTMLSTVDNVLNREIELNPYESLFSTDENEMEDEKNEFVLEGYNEFIKLAIPLLNEGKRPNLLQMAKQTGIDHETAKKLWAILRKTKKGSS
jgi:hypothetical protein